MPSFYRLLSIRYLWQRWDRAALIVASIALGVSTLVSSRIFNQCIGTAAATSTTPVGVGDLFVSNGEFGVQRAVASDIRAAHIPGVERVQPLVYDRVYLPGQDHRAAVLVGVEFTPELLTSDNPLGIQIEWTGEGPKFQLLPILAAVQAREFARAAELWKKVPNTLVIVSRTVHEQRAARSGAGEPLAIRYGARDVPCVPVGVFDIPDGSPLATLGRNVVAMELGQAARFTRPGPTIATASVASGAANDALWELVAPERVNRIDLSLHPAADRTATLAAVRAVVGDRADVRTPEVQGASTREIISGLQLAFGFCSAAAMVVGLFLVYNALAVTVAERRHDIGILRSIGATRGQIVGLFSALAVVLGLLGSAIGVPLGVGMSRAILYEFREELGSMFLSGELAAGWPTTETIVLAIAAGVATAVFAALVPAVQAATQDPADAVRRVPGVAGGAWRVAHQAACVTLVAGGLAMIATRHELPQRIGSFFGMMAVLVGLLLSAPIFVSILVRLTHPILRRLLPIEARLAADNLTRAPGRTGVVIGALGAGVAVMIQTAGVGRSNEEPVTKWLDDVIQADRFVFGGNVTEAASSQAPMDPEVVRGLATLGGVDAVTGIRYVRPEYNGTVVFLIALDAATFAEQTARRAGPDPDGLDKVRHLPGGERVIVSENFARRHGVGPGGTITLTGTRGPVTLSVLDTVRDYSWTRGTIFMDRTEYARLFGDPLVDVAHVFLTDADGSKAVAGFASDRGLMVQDRPTMRKFLADLIDRVYALAYMQQVVVGIVASLGVVTALLISVLQRKRELGLLLAVGATPGQVVRSVIWEAVLMGLFGTVLGVLIGLPMEWYVLRVVVQEESGFVFDLVVPWQQGLGIAVGAIGMAAVAGLLPALHAVRTRIPEAIAHE